MKTLIPALLLTLSACSSSSTDPEPTQLDDEPERWILDTGPTLQRAFDEGNVWGCRRAILNQNQQVTRYPVTYRTFALQFDPANSLLYIYTSHAGNDVADMWQMTYRSYDSPSQDNWGTFHWDGEDINTFEFRDSTSMTRGLDSRGSFFIGMNSSHWVCSQQAYGEMTVTSLGHGLP